VPTEAPDNSRPHTPTDSPVTIALIGATPLAEQIASRALDAGHRVIIDDVSDVRLQATSTNLHAVLGAQHRRAPGPQDQSVSARSDSSSPISVDSPLSNLSLTQSIESAIRSADFLVDTLPDDLEVKLELFTLFDKFAKPDTIFITTGTIPIDDLAGITFCPDRCVALSLVHSPNDTDITFHIRPGTQTSPQTIASINLFARICNFRAARI
jgi:3-hydroxybutyryl-CoA dehydrogenase